MSLVLADARPCDDGISATFVSEHGVQALVGTPAEIARLANVMKQVAALATLNETEKVWLEDVVVGDVVVRLGLGPGGEARVAFVHGAGRR
jgi:hypothetical protein